MCCKCELFQLFVVFPIHVFRRWFWSFGTDVICMRFYWSWNNAKVAVLVLLFASGNFLVSKTKQFLAKGIKCYCRCCLAKSIQCSFFKHHRKIRFRSCTQNWFGNFSGFGVELYLFVCALTVGRFAQVNRLTNSYFISAYTSCQG